MNENTRAQYSCTVPIQFNRTCTRESSALCLCSLSSLYISLCRQPARATDLRNKSLADASTDNGHLESCVVSRGSNVER